jgi:hypothetical protein
MAEETSGVAMWRRVLAFVLDLITSFGGFGYLIARFTGGLTESGFKLNGAPALLLFGLVIGYFVVARYIGGTLWQRILRAR